MYLRISFRLIAVGSVPLIAKGLYNIGFLIQAFSSPDTDEFWAAPIEDIVKVIVVFSLVLVIIPILCGIVNVRVYKEYPLAASISALLGGATIFALYVAYNNPLPEAILMGLSSLALMVGSGMTL